MGICGVGGIAMKKLTQKVTFTHNFYIGASMKLLSMNMMPSVRLLAGANWKTKAGQEAGR